MKARSVIAAAVLTAVTPAEAHRVDEYLQATFVSLEKDQVKLELFLTPGVAVASTVLAGIDSDGDGTISVREQQAYAKSVIANLSLTLNGVRVAPRLVAMEFPAVADMREGLGGVRLKLGADLPKRTGNGSLRLENYHRSAFSVYQVNGLMPSNREIKFGAEQRNPSQSIYEVEYTRVEATGALAQGSRAWWMIATSTVVCGALTVVWLKRRAQFGQP